MRFRLLQFVAVFLVSLVTACEEAPSKRLDAQVRDLCCSQDMAVPIDGPSDLNATQDAAGQDAAPVSDGMVETDAATDDATPSVCPTVKPTGFCNAQVQTNDCTYGTDVCSCAAVCSGAPPDPGETHAWHCAPSACPVEPPVHGSNCVKDGLICSWPTCGPTTATCIGDIWNVDLSDPPA